MPKALQIGTSIMIVGTIILIIMTNYGFNLLLSSGIFMFFVVVALVYLIPEISQAHHIFGILIVLTCLYGFWVGVQNIHYGIQYGVQQTRLIKIRTKLEHQKMNTLRALKTNQHNHDVYKANQLKLQALKIEIKTTDQQLSDLNDKLNNVN